MEAFALIPQSTLSRSDSSTFSLTRMEHMAFQERTLVTLVEEPSSIRTTRQPSSSDRARKSGQTSHTASRKARRSCFPSVVETQVTSLPATTQPSRLETSCTELSALHLPHGQGRVRSVTLVWMASISILKLVLLLSLSRWVLTTPRWSTTFALLET